LVLVAVIGGMGVAEADAQRTSRSGLEDRFDVRATTAAGFLQSYTAFSLSQESDQASTRLSGPEVTEAEFNSFVQSFGFGPAVLLDAHGRALHVAPNRPDLIGTDLGGRYDHLRSAVGGVPAVSNVVKSAAKSVPIVAFAVPFETPEGRRVVSGGYDLGTRPMGLYLQKLVPLRGSAAYLVDAASEVIASDSGRTGQLNALDPRLAAAVAAARGRSYRGSGGASSHYVAEPVAGTPWRLVLSVPEASLYSPLTRSVRFLPWLFLTAFALVAMVLVGLLVRGREARRRLTTDAGTDVLTGLPNRRWVEERALAVLSAARRHTTSTGVLMVDIDHFKTINDTWGHGAGDEVLRAVAQRLRACCRVEDEVGRWGGDEFVVVLSDTTPVATKASAERIRCAIAEIAVDVSGRQIAVTASIGGAAGTAEDFGTLLSAADSALFAAKKIGRNVATVMPCPPSDDSSGPGGATSTAAEPGKHHLPI